MASDDLGPIQPQLGNGLSSRVMFADEAIHFPRGGRGDDHAPRKFSGGGGFAIDERERFGRPHYGLQKPSWTPDGRQQSDGSEGEDEEDDAEDDVNDDEDVGEGDGLVSFDENNNVRNGNNSSGSVQSTSDKGNGDKGRDLRDHHSPFGFNRGMMVKENNLSEQQKQQQQHERVGNYENSINVERSELYCTQIMNGGDRSRCCQKEVRGDNGHRIAAGKEVDVLADPSESLRRHLLDPVTGVLMDDAVILPCGHSFGSGGMQHILRMKACCKCSRNFSEDSVRPNLALRSAVQAFRCEEESQSSKFHRRKRDKFLQEKCNYDDLYLIDSRGKGVQFPFVVSDRVIIKGNKRTPQRFVGRVAVVTTQCLNGWYVVKTLDNSESVKLQYRSLAKVPDDFPTSNIQSKAVVPSWL